MIVWYIFIYLMGIIFAFLGWWVIIGNFAGIYGWLFHRKHYSMAPFLGGFFAFVGMGLNPVPQIQRFCWVPFLIDLVFFCLPMLIGLLIGLFMMLFNKKKPDGNAAKEPAAK